MKITIPFCYLPNAKTQTFDMESCQRSLFQVNQLKAVSEREDFAYFVIMTDTDGEVIMHPDFHCKCHIMWYDKDGQCWWGILGVMRFLYSDGWNKVGLCASPVPLESLVYQSRISQA